MASLVIPNENKVAKNHLLLGNIQVDMTDCSGNPYTIEGIVANDFVVKMINGTTEPLVPFIQNSAGGSIDGNTLSITTTEGVVNLGQLVESLMSNEVHTLTEAQDLVNLA